MKKVNASLAADRGRFVSMGMADGATALSSSAFQDLSSMRRLGSSVASSSEDPSHYNGGSNTATNPFERMRQTIRQDIMESKSNLINFLLVSRNRGFKWLILYCCEILLFEWK